MYPFAFLIDRGFLSFVMKENILNTVILKQISGYVTEAVNT